jgi:hypothetical protein
MVARFFFLQKNKMRKKYQDVKKYKMAQKYSKIAIKVPKCP